MPTTTDFQSLTPASPVETQPPAANGAMVGIGSTGWLGGILERVSNPRKHRWNRYLRACKAIPKTSPVAGSTSFAKINARRHELIDSAFADDDDARLDRDPEYRACSNAVSAWLCGPTVVSCFRMSREIRRLEALTSPNSAVNH